MAACYGIIDDTLGPASSSDRATASVRRGTTDSDLGSQDPAGKERRKTCKPGRLNRGGNPRGENSLPAWAG